MGEALFRRRLMLDGSHLLFKLENYTTDGTSNTAVNTGLSLFDGSYSEFRIEFDFIINAATPAQGSFIRCRDANSPWSGFCIRLYNTGSGVQVQANTAQANTTSSPVSVRCVGTILFNGNNLSVSAYVDGLNKSAYCTGVSTNSPFTIGGELDSNNEWKSDRFGQMTINYIRVYDKQYIN